MLKKMTDTEIKEAILNAASKLFSHYGFNKTTMEDIAKAVRKGKSTLYYYYKSKEDVILDLISRETCYIFDKINAAIRLNISAYERLYTYFNVVTQEVEKVANLYNICRLELKENFIIQKRLKEIYNDKQVEVIKDILIYGVERREFQAINKDEVSEIATLIDTIFLNLIIFLLIEQEIPNWQKQIITLGNIVNRGLR